MLVETTKQRLLTS